MINTAQLTQLVNRLICQRCRNNCLVCGEPFPVKAVTPKSMAAQSDLEALAMVMEDQSLPTMRQKARALAPMLRIHEEAAMSRVRRVKDQIQPQALTISLPLV